MSDFPTPDPIHDRLHRELGELAHADVQLGAVREHRRTLSDGNSEVTIEVIAVISDVRMRLTGSGCDPPAAYADLMRRVEEE